MLDSGIDGLMQRLPPPHAHVTESLLVVLWCTLSIRVYRFCSDYIQGEYADYDHDANDAQYESHQAQDISKSGTSRCFLGSLLGGGVTYINRSIEIEYKYRNRI